MSREIKFRIWHKKQKFMSSLWQIDWEHNIVMHDKRKPADLRDTILLQFTGLKDMNGVEIYEGDVVEFYGKNREVVWVKSGCSFALKSKNKFNPNQYVMLSINNFVGQSEHKVIGNIYENPELLEGQK